jgi:HEAT repeat protein
MLTYYCPSCWSELREDLAECPNCGFDVAAYKQAPYEEKLLRAAFHPIPSIRAMAISILGRIGSAQAVPILERIVREEKQDIYVLLEAVQALARIEDPAGENMLLAATQHPFPVVQRRAKELVEWRRHRTG